MNFEEIKKKYVKEVKERDQAISEAKRKRDVQMAVVEHLKAEREKYRGVVSFDAKKMWNNLTFRITSAISDYNRLDAEYHKIMIGSDIDNVIKSII